MTESRRPKIKRIGLDKAHGGGCKTTTMTMRHGYWMEAFTAAPGTTSADSVTRNMLMDRVVRIFLESE